MGIFGLHALEKNPTGGQIEAIEAKYKGGVSEDQFKKLFNSKESGERPVAQDKQMREVLSVLDKDGAGSVSVVELRSILQNLGDAIPDNVLNTLFKEIKVDVNGQVKNNLNHCFCLFF